MIGLLLDMPRILVSSRHVCEVEVWCSRVGSITASVDLTIIAGGFFGSD